MIIQILAPTVTYFCHGYHHDHLFHNSKGYPQIWTQGFYHKAAPFECQEDTGIGSHPDKSEQDKKTVTSIEICTINLKDKDM